MRIDEWPLGGLPEGVYTLRVEAIDHDRNESSAEVTIYVGVDAPEPGEDSTGGEGTTGSDDAVDGTAGSSGEPSDDDEPEVSTTIPGPDQMDDGGEGCGCRTSPNRMPLRGLLALLGLSPRRRRGRRG